MKTHTIAVLIAIFGATGALTRYAVCSWAERHWGSFPGGTLFVNIVGCFLLGALLQAAATTQIIPEPWPAIIGVGFLGALTTFSTFGAETYLMWTANKPGAALTHIGLHVVLGLAAVWAGNSLVRAVVESVGKQTT